MPKSRSHKRSRELWRGVGSTVRRKDAMDNTFCQKFKPSIQNGMSRNVNRKRDTAASDKVSCNVTLKERDVGAEVNCN